MSVSGNGANDIRRRRLIASLARDWHHIALVVTGVTAAAYLATSWMTPLYSGETRILIETAGPSSVRAHARDGIDAQIQLIGSDEILGKVAAGLEARPHETTLLNRVLSLGGLLGEPDPLSREERALHAMRDNLDIYRADRSRVIVVAFSSDDPQLAAQIPNAIADAYIAHNRSAALPANVAANEAPDDIVTGATVLDLPRRRTGVKPAAPQQISALSDTLSHVRTERLDAEASAASIRAALENGSPPDAVGDLAGAGLIQGLAEHEAQLRAEIANLSSTLLDNHPRMRALRAQLADLGRQMRAEAKKVQESLERKATAAGGREQELVADIDRLTALPAVAKVEAPAPDDLFTRNPMLVASASPGFGAFMADARIFQRATVPDAPYFPRVLPIVSTLFAASLLLMLSITMIRARRVARYMPHDDGSIRLPELDEERFQDEHRDALLAVAAAPVTETSMQAHAPASASETEDDMHHDHEQALPRTTGEVDVQTLAERIIASTVARAVVVSPEGDAGAATSVMLARAVADAGLRVVLLDLTMTGAAARPMVEDAALKGITDLLCAEAQFGDVIHTDLYSESHVIPVGTADLDRAMNAIERLPVILQSLGAAFDLVVAECGEVEAGEVEHLVDRDTALVISALEISEKVADTVEIFIAEGMRPTIVSPGAEPHLPDEAA